MTDVAWELVARLVAGIAVLAAGLALVAGARRGPAQGSLPYVIDKDVAAAARKHALTLRYLLLGAGLLIVVAAAAFLLLLGIRSANVKAAPSRGLTDALSTTSAAAIGRAAEASAPPGEVLPAGSADRPVRTDDSVSTPISLREGQTSDHDGRKMGNGMVGTSREHGSRSAAPRGRPSATEASLTKNLGNGGSSRRPRPGGSSVDSPPAQSGQGAGALNPSSDRSCPCGARDETVVESDTPSRIALPHH